MGVPAGVALSKFSVDHTADGIKKWNTPYDSDLGKKVKESFNTPIYDNNPATDIIINVGENVALAGAGKVVGVGLNAAENGIKKFFKTETKVLEKTAKQELKLAEEAAINKPPVTSEKLVTPKPNAKAKPNAPEPTRESAKPATPKEVIQITQGKKGNWEKQLNKPEPNKIYDLGNSKKYHTDNLGRKELVEFKLGSNKSDRNNYQQGKSGGTDRLPTDCGGHYCAASTGGPGEQINLTPMDKKLNGPGGAYYKLEQDWAKEFKKGNDVYVKIKPNYNGNSERASSFKIEYRINGGERIIRELKNTPTGK